MVLIVPVMVSKWHKLLELIWQTSNKSVFFLLHVCENVLIVERAQVQVHPTGLVDPREPDAKVKWLAAEALRGAGGKQTIVLVFFAFARESDLRISAQRCVVGWQRTSFLQRIGSSRLCNWRNEQE
jgi:hypothetical protein